MVKDVRINGVKDLTKEDQSIVNNLVEKRLKKLDREIKKDFSLTAIVKEYEKEGSRKKYSVDFTLKIGQQFFKSKDTNWNLAKALNGSLDKIETEIEHKLHVSDQHEKLKLREPRVRKF